MRKYFETYTISTRDIVAADETSVQYDCTGNSTIELKGSKTLLLASTGHDKICVTVMLAASASGLKKPTIVFKGKCLNSPIMLTFNFPANFDWLGNPRFESKLPRDFGGKSI